MSDLLNTSGTEYEFDAGAVDSIDQSSVEGGGPSYPVIQWVYGDLKAKKFGGMDYLGGFFVKAEKVDGATLEAAGWTKTSRTFENGTEEEGYWKREAALSIIAERKRWEINPQNGDRQTFAWSGFDKAKEANGGKNPSSRTHYLVLVKGLENVGPFVLTMKGAAGAAFESYRDANSVISRFANTVIAAANAASDAAAKKAGKPSGKRWAFRAFWLPVGANRNDKAEPVYKEVGKAPNTTNVVLPIALGLPDKAANVDLKRFYVGNDLLQFVNALFDQSSEWRTAWENIKPGTVEGGDAPAVEDHAEKDNADAALAAAGL
jgi:hypothetical protein